MTDPIRLSKSIIDGAGRRILSSVVEDVPPAGSKDALVASLGLASSSIAAAGIATVAAKASKGAVAASLWSAPLVKVATVITVGALAAAGTVTAIEGRETSESIATARSRPPVVLPTSAPPARQAPARELPEAPPEAPPVSRVERHDPRPLARPAPSVAESRARAVVSDELALLDDARRRLAGGDARGAHERLDEHGRRFPRGALSHESTAMRVDALVRLGRAQDAARLARSFLAAHPESTQAPRVRRLAERASNF